MTKPYNDMGIVLARTGNSVILQLFTGKNVRRTIDIELRKRPGYFNREVNHDEETFEKISRDRYRVKTSHYWF